MRPETMTTWYLSLLPSSARTLAGPSTPTYSSNLPRKLLHVGKSGLCWDHFFLYMVSHYLSFWRCGKGKVQPACRMIRTKYLERPSQTVHARESR